MRRRRGAVGPVAIPIAVGLWVPWRSGPVPAPAERQADVPATTAQTIPDPAPPVIPIAVDSDEPLPPADAPLAEARSTLETRARRGDRRAACRLAVEAHFCLNNPVDSEAVEFFETSIAQQAATRPGDVEWIAHLEAQHARALAVCRDLPPRWLDETAWQWQLLAAQLGDPTLAAWYAISPSLDRNSFLERPEPWQVYRVNALPLLQRAVAAGDVRATWYLRELLAGEARLIGMPNAVAPDPRLADVYLVALRQATTGAASIRDVERQLAEARARHAPEAWRAIEAEGLALARDRFAGQAPVDWSRGVFRDALDPARCDQR